jgi:catechol 2,3-dioxygenase-like lactoylglutathione lyase family enzyme
MSLPIPPVAGVHHVKIPVHDPAASRDFYCRILGFQEDISFTEDGVLMGVAMIHPETGIRYAVRKEPERAAALRGFDPVALAVPTRADLEAWVAHLDAVGVPHGPIMNGQIGWLVGLYDPDGIEVRLYTLERPQGV